jgi:hypothetical protein
MVKVNRPLDALLALAVDVRARAGGVTALEGAAGLGAAQCHSSDQRQFQAFVNRLSRTTPIRTCSGQLRLVDGGVRHS